MEAGDFVVINLTLETSRRSLKEAPFFGEKRKACKARHHNTAPRLRLKQDPDLA